MESTNHNNLLHHHHHHLQDQQKPHDNNNVEACSSSCYGVGSSHSWSSPNTTMDGDDNLKIQDYLGYNNNEENKDMMMSNGRLLMKNLSQEEQYYSTSSTNAQSHYHNYIGGNNNNINKAYISIYPTINVSNLNHPSAEISSSIMHHHQPLDLLTSTTTTTSSSKDHHHHHGLNGQLFTENLFHNIIGLDDHHMQHSTTSIPSQHFTNNNNGMMVETKRSSSTLMESSNASKKSRPQSSRSSCQHLKIRKEKLGDRIAALQQLVAPFGKTDTASVLLEAIGYIKFLQSQVETLSVPYMKSSRNQISRGLIMRQGVSARDNIMNSEAKHEDLRSRGLCLVPMSCMAYIAGDDGGGCGAWQQPPNFGGPT
ncbi:transcription factor bHLH110-like [Arachis stenosperma]|uniref:transcription factor bHLH110-like n=1 Tax=Arachis stenosperma TaxID=217475 RepID=UPI0025ABBF2F|nr:transcription factor bHLH110-like [Arachis stenosperma]